MNVVSIQKGGFDDENREEGILDPLTANDGIWVQRALKPWLRSKVSISAPMPR